MKTLDESLLSRKNEIEDMRKTIADLKSAASALKPAVQQYNEQMKKTHELDKVRKAKERELNIVINFLRHADEHYLDYIFPLFKTEEVA